MAGSLAGVAGVLLAVALFSVAAALRKAAANLEDMKSALYTALEDRNRLETDRAGIERRDLELREKAGRPKVVLSKAANMKLFEEKQQLSVAYRVETIGPVPVFVRKLQVAVSNRKAPELTRVLDMLFNKVLGPDKLIEGEAVITVRDFAKISLPFVPDFDFIKESCQVVASIEYEDQAGEVYRQSKDILEW